MGNFWTLAGFEYKKLLQKKVVWVTFIIMAVICILAVCLPYWMNSYSIDGKTVSGYEMTKRSIKQSKEQSGTKIDDSYLKKAKEEPDSIPNSIYSFLFLIMDSSGKEIGDFNMADLYNTRKELIEQRWGEAHLTKGETEYLASLERQVEIPVVYEYSEGYDLMNSMMSFVCMMQILLAAVSIPSILADEHKGRTDQIILCTHFGKKVLYMVKGFVGVTFSVVSTLLLSLAVAIPIFAVYGFDGFTASIQQSAPMQSWMMTLGEKFLIIIAVNLISAVLHCAAGMMLAEKARGTVAPMAILIGFMMISMFLDMPERYRILAQAWDCVPGNILTSGGPFGVRLFSIFGYYFTSWQMVPIIWLLISAAVLLSGYRLYKNYQVAGM